MRARRVGLVLVVAGTWVVSACDDATIRMTDARVGPTDAGVDADTGGDEPDAADAADASDADVDAGPIDPPERPADPAPIGAAWIAGAMDPASARPTVAAAELPAMVCPPGWIASSRGDDPSVCEPWPSGAHEACDPGFVHLPGRPGCERLGADCPAGEWPVVAAGEAALYVRAGATGGDGTMVSPVGTVTDALALGVRAGTVIALAKGTHVGSVSIPAGASGVILRGACAAETTLVPSSGAAVRAGAAGVAIENVRIEGGLQGVVVAALDVVLRGIEIRDTTDEGVLVLSGASLVADGIRVLGAGTDGIGVADVATATIRRAEILRFGSRDPVSRAAVRCHGIGTRCTVEDAGVGDAGNDGIAIVDGAMATLRRVVIEGTQSAGLYLLSSDTTASDLVVRDVTRRAAGTAFGLSVHFSAADLTRLLVERTEDTGLHIADMSRVQLTDGVVRDVAADGTLARGILVAEQSRITLSRVAMLRCQDEALASDGESSIASGADLWIVGGGSGPIGGVSSDAGSLTLDEMRIEGVAGAGVVVRGGARVTLDEATIVGTHASSDWPGAATMATAGTLSVRDSVMEGNEGPGVWLARASPSDPPAEATLDDVAIVGDASGAEGARIERGRFEATAVSFVGSFGSAVRASGAGAVVSLTDVLAVGVARSDGSPSVAFDVGEGATFDATRVALYGSSAHGLVARGRDVSATLLDVSIVGPLDGVGLVALDGAGIEAERVAIEGATGLGAGAFGGESTLLLRSASVLDTTRDTGGAAVGIGAFDGAVVSADGFVSGGALECGLEVEGAGSSLDVVNGYVERNELGACLLASGYDEARVRDHVLYVRNGTDVDREARATPAAP
ncbi:MAG: hypothetical protein IT379_11350 [Deltaproteobacteria bacterium]|nr:hypothetical protein [Deltaproteobacteria bacterium]